MKKKERAKVVAKKQQIKPHSMLMKPLIKGDYLFWLAHGVNYILSDFDNGIWSPLFESVYEGKTLTADNISKTVMEKYAGLKEWPVEAKAALAWTVSDPKLVQIYYREVLRRAQSTYPDRDDIESFIREPKNSTVWEVFSFIKEKLQKH